MNHEERLKTLLRENAVDPGPKQDWESFRRTAHRDQFVRRTALVGGVAAVVAVLMLMNTVLRDGLFDRSLPKPANREETQLEEDVNDSDDLQLERGGDGLEEQLDKAPRWLVGKNRVSSGTSSSRPDAPKDDAQEDGGDAPPGVVEEVPEPPDPPSLRCREEKATIVGTDDDDVLRGTPGHDVIVALGGDDVVHGGSGFDYICAGDGNDTLYGDEGPDSLLGEAGDDVISGGAGTFDLVEHPGFAGPVRAFLSDGIVEGDGNDRVTEIEVVIGSPAADTLAGDDADNWLLGEAGNDLMNGEGGDDLLQGGPGNDEMLGSDGSDVVAFWAASSPNRPGVNVDLSSNRAVGEGVDAIDEFERVIGSLGDDVISGDIGPNTLNGDFGDDTVSGGGGDDYVLGSMGDDKLDGGTGDDFADGGMDIDTCTTVEQRQNCEAGNPVGGPPAPRRAPLQAGGYALPGRFTRRTLARNRFL